MSIHLNDTATATIAAIVVLLCSIVKRNDREPFGIAACVLRLLSQQALAMKTFVAREYATETGTR